MRRTSSDSWPTTTTVLEPGAIPGVVNYKFTAMPENVAVLDLERARLAGMRDLFWQTDTSVGFTSWGFIENHRYKSVSLILTEFVDVISKKGCLLLNVGPRADGTIPEKEAEMLREIGAWLRVNGEAIYGSRPLEDLRRRADRDRRRTSQRAA